MSGETVIHPAVEGCLHVLDRADLMLDRIPETLYTNREDSRDSIGCHLRHAIEHITCFLDGVDTGVIDYDVRQRDILMETSVAAMRGAIEGVRVRFTAFDSSHVEKDIQVRQIPAPRHASSEVRSSVERELIFLSSHMVHHLSLMYLHCLNAGVELPKDFPLAFSTSAHRNVAVG